MLTIVAPVPPTPEIIIAEQAAIAARQNGTFTIPLEAAQFLGYVVNELGEPTGQFALVQVGRKITKDPINLSGTVDYKFEAGFIGGKCQWINEKGERVDYNPNGTGPIVDQLRAQSSVPVKFVSPGDIITEEMQQEFVLPNGKHDLPAQSHQFDQLTRYIAELLSKASFHGITTTKPIKVEGQKIITNSHIIMVLAPVTVKQLKAFNDLVEENWPRREAHGFVLASLIRNEKGMPMDFGDFRDLDGSVIRVNGVALAGRKTVKQLVGFNGDRVNTILAMHGIVTK